MNFCPLAFIYYYHCECVHVGIRGQLWGVSSCLPPCWGRVPPSCFCGAASWRQVGSQAGQFSCLCFPSWRRSVGIADTCHHVWLFFFLWVLRIELSLRHLASPKFCSLPPANLFHLLPSPTETVIPMSPPVPCLRHEPLSLIRVVWAQVEGSLLEYHQLISGYTAEETPPSTAQAAINYLQSLREACGLMNPLSIHDAS